MYLKRLILQNFRNYESFKFEFNFDTCFIIGPNTSGKTNFVEAICLLSTGHSFRAEKVDEAVSFNQSICRIVADVSPSIKNNKDLTRLEIVIQKEDEGKRLSHKKYMVNGVSKRRVDFTGSLVYSLFLPVDLDIIVDSPSLRRRFLDDLLLQVDREYRVALIAYNKGLRQRNALLARTKEEGIKNEKQFEYWNNFLIENGELITRKREDLITYINNFTKDIFDFVIFYDKSVISKTRLLQYKEAEISAGITLVGPHRDDMSFHMYNNIHQTTHDIKLFGSRGQQRLAILQLKLIELAFIKKSIQDSPLLILDDIFSELDDNHIKLVSSLIGGQQTFITTTRKEFVSAKLFKNTDVIELNK